MTRRDPVSPEPDARLEIAAAALLAVVVLVQLPLTLHAGSRADFRFGLWQLLPVWIGLAGMAWGVAVVACRWVPASRRPVLGPVLWATAVWAWVSGNLVVFTFGLLTGAPLEFGDKKVWAIPELLLGGALLAAGFYWARRSRRAARRIAIAGLVLVGAQTLLALLEDLPKSASLTPTRPAALARFAATDNVLVILLDTFQGDIFAELVAAEPELAKKFEGFQFFANALGVARTTALTMPAVHTGLRYEEGWTLAEYQRNAQTRASFLGQAVRAGSEVTVVNPFGFCPPRAAWCGELDRLVGSPWRSLGAEALLPVDLALFRVAPLIAKRALYGRGRWLMLRGLGIHRGRLQQQQSFDLLRLMALEARVEEGGPTLKFLHLPTPHSPLVASADCALASEDLPKERVHVLDQSRCALREVSALLDRLRALRILDSALVVLMADHGAGLPHSESDPELPREWRERMGAANPLLLVKFPGASGELAVSQQAAQIDDVGKTVCDAVSGCGYGVGRPLSFRGGPRRMRHYLDYTWRTDFWYQKGRIDVTNWEVRGPLRNRESWRRVAPSE